MLQRWAEDPALGKWVNRQRQHKRKLDRGDPSEGMTAERAARLAAYKEVHGDCDVPQGWAEDPQLDS